MISDSVSDFILGLRDPSLLLEKALLTADKVQDTVARALRQILRLVRWAFISLGVSLLLAIVLLACLSTGSCPPWLNLLLLLVSGLGALAGLILLAPLVMLAQPVIDAFPGFKAWLKKYPSMIASAGFLLLFALFSYWRLQQAFSPSAAGKILFVMLIVGAGSATGWVLLPRASVKAIITSQLFLCLFFLMASAILPKLLPASSRWLRHRESLAAEHMDDSISQLVKIDPDNVPKVWFNADGSPRYSFTQGRDGVYRVFHADVTSDPGTGEGTSLVTTTEKRDEIIAQARSFRDTQQIKETEKTAERNRQAQLDADRRFREKYLDGSVLAASKDQNAVVLVIKAEKTSDSDLLAQHLSAWLEHAGRTPVYGALKPAFLDDGLFDLVWNGDGSTLTRLKLLQGAPGSLLLAKADYTDVEKTNFDGVLSVQGRLSFIAIDRKGRKGPTSVESPGAGSNATTAKSNCAKRLVEAASISDVLRD